MLELLPGGLLPETLEGFDCWDRPINIQEHLQVRVHVSLLYHRWSEAGKRNIFVDILNWRRHSCL